MGKAMSGRDDGGPAFAGGVIPDNGSPMQTGMSLRDWFAGQWVAGLASATPLMTEQHRADATNLAKWAYGMADAMLAERSKP
jgi:hypothetical protein